MGPLPETPNGNKYVMTCIDYFSKWVEIVPLKDKTSEGVAEEIYALMCRYVVTLVASYTCTYIYFFLSYAFRSTHVT